MLVISSLAPYRVVFRIWTLCPRAGSAATPYMLYGQCAPFGYRGAFMRLVRVEVLDATGHHGDARELLADARDRLHRIAAEIPDEAIRRSYLERVPENARTIELAENWFGKLDA